MMAAKFSVSCALIAGLLCTSGCLERRVFITSEPAGALIYANDIELGRTPLEADFTYYGKYDVRVELEGFEPLRTVAKANTPIYEIPPLDLVSMAVPADIETEVRWHFVLAPALERTMDTATFEAQLLERAHGLRSTLAATDDAPKPAEGETAEVTEGSALEPAPAPEQAPADKPVENPAQKPADAPR
jgi:hypothetical protein